jgi:hypothetical protein
LLRCCGGLPEFRGDMQRICSARIGFAARVRQPLIYFEENLKSVEVPLPYRGVQIGHGRHKRGPSLILAAAARAAWRSPRVAG